MHTISFCCKKLISMSREINMHNIIAKKKRLNVGIDAELNKTLMLSENTLHAVGLN